MKIPKDVLSLNLDELDLDPKAKTLVGQLLNIIEQMAQTIKELQKENQKPKDEINRLKGEKGKPNIKPNVPKKEYDICRKRSSKKKWTKRSKKSQIKIDRVEVRQVNQDILPPDAEYKGYRCVVVQTLEKR